MTVYLTSFKRYYETPGKEFHSYDYSAYSVAVYQPSWYAQLTKLDLFDIRDPSGQWVRPRDFINDDWLGGSPPPRDYALLRRYHDALLGMYEKRWANQPEDRQLGFLERVADRDEVWCCWCPYDKAAQRQLEDYGSFVCHTWPIETFLKQLGVDVVRDLDRERMVRL